MKAKHIGVSRSLRPFLLRKSDQRYETLRYGTCQEKASKSTLKVLIGSCTKGLSRNNIPFFARSLEPCLV